MNLVSASFKILHILRAPIGGLFRHVADLARAQAAAGHSVGVVCCAEAADRLTEQRLTALRDSLSLGLERVAMARDIDFRDVTATRATRAIAERFGADVLHGHGAKGGAYARLAASTLKRAGARVISVYTPHGGSLHYAPNSLKGRIFMGLERLLARKADGIIFESAYSARVYQDNVAARGPLVTKIIPNGVQPDEFEPVAVTDAPADFVFVGELRKLKGVDLLLEALARINDPSPPRAVIVGDGPDAAEFKDQARALELGDRVSFPGAMPARTAFALGRSLVMPSRAESFPYIVLEAGAAAMPLIATDVGGIPEIVAGSPVALVPPRDVDALAAQMRRHLEDPAGAARDALGLQRAIKERFTTSAMSASVEAFYENLMMQR